MSIFRGIKSNAMLGFGSLFLLLLATGVTSNGDTINTTQSLRDGDSIVSSGGKFELGFFSPRSGSFERYLGIWYHGIPDKTVVWVANREIPLPDASSGVLRITSQGVLTLLGRNETVVWSSSSSFSSSGSAASSPVAQLLDSGNLLVNHAGRTVWQSFDHPADTLLPEMKLGWDLETRHERFLSNWMAEDDPSRGNFTYRFELGGYPEVVVKENLAIMSRSGPYDGLAFSGYRPLRPDPFYIFAIVIDPEEIYYSFDLKNKSYLSRLVVQPSGNVQLFIWTGNTGWQVYLSVQGDDCDRYAVCGAYGICNINNTNLCSCLEGFVPKIPEEWNRYNWTSGCVRKRELNCSSDDGFQKYSGIKLPDTRKSWYNDSLSLVECKQLCARNCSCTAYTTLDITVGNGCLLWLHELIDLKESVYGQDIYIRMSASELDRPSSNRKKQLGIAFGCITSVGMLFLAIYICRKKLKGSSNMKGQKEDVDLPLFDLETISQATNNFSENNKIGKGGFGTVYLGILKDGLQIAVKRLSMNSRQGMDEFMNEVVHIAKLQHRNLVRLLGCCVDEDEKVLIYEFMPNKSLDIYIFEGKDEIAQLLNWPNRYSIINGIARGLLYLHQDSRLRIIHRDLKVSNVLLDPEMNPKISDFGLARSFIGNESEAKTKKVVGTYGYMSPEYAIDGLYSTKSDVFSFGVMVLEIISGKRNRGFSHPDHQLNLLGHAWTLFTEDRSSELATNSITESCVISQVHRVIQTGLLCVQRNPEDRPSMSDVVLMLGSDGALPKPKQPGFFSERDLIDLNLSPTSSMNKGFSPNEASITMLDAR